MSTRKQKKESSLVSLTLEQLRRLPKPRAGFEQLAVGLLELYKKNLDKLEMSGVDVDAAAETLAELESLQAMHVEAQKQLALIEDTILYRSSSVWTVVLEIYARAIRVAHTDGAIARAIAPFAQFMKIGPRKKVTTTPPSTTPVTTG